MRAAVTSSRSTLAAPLRAPRRAKSATSRRGGACATRARLDAGVGAFGSKAGMTQVFTDDGLCVPVTVIAVRDGNVVTQVRAKYRATGFGARDGREGTGARGASNDSTRARGSRVGRRGGWMRAARATRRRARRAEAREGWGDIVFDRARGRGSRDAGEARGGRTRRARAEKP